MGKLELRWQIAGLNCNHGESEPANGQRGFRRCLLFSPVCLTFAVIEEVIWTRKLGKGVALILMNLRQEP